MPEKSDCKFSHTQSKICDLNTVVARVANIQASGSSVVFTNGVFDLLHAGHVTYLEEARALGSHLVVALNSDSSVKTNKGDRRPIVGQEDRAKLVASLQCVDFVFLFEMKTPVSAIELIKPMVYVKGGDYRVEDLPETPVVRQYGGMVKILSLVKGRSSTQLIQKILEVYGSIETS